GQALIVAQVIALALLFLRGPARELALTLIGAEPAVTQHARTYFDIRIWSAPATLANFALIGWFIGLQNARVPLAIVLVTNVTNIVLDLLLVLGFDMKVDGVAAATVTAEYAGLATALAFARAELVRRGGHFAVDALVSLRAYSAFLAINGNLFVRTLSLMFTFAFLTAQGARQGGLVLAANAILLNFQNLLSFALDGFAHAAPALGAPRARLVAVRGDRLRAALPARRALPGRPADRPAGSRRHDVALPAVDRRLAAGVGLGVPVRRRVRRCDARTGNARHHARLDISRVPACVVPAEIG